RRVSLGYIKGFWNVLSQKGPQRDGRGDVVHLDANDLDAGRDGERTGILLLIEQRRPIPVIPATNRLRDLRALQVSIELVQILEDETGVEMIDECFGRAVDRVQPGSIGALRLQNELQVA